jgi:hypothetical protein
MKEKKVEVGLSLTGADKQAALEFLFLLSCSSQASVEPFCRSRVFKGDEALSVPTVSFVVFCTLLFYQRYPILRYCYSSPTRFTSTRSRPSLLPSFVAERCFSLLTVCILLSRSL